MDTHERAPLAVVTGASSGIGLELGRQFAQHGYDLVIAAEDAAIEEAARELATEGVTVTPVSVDLATPEGVRELYRRARDTTAGVIDVLVVNAGVGLGGPFVDHDLEAQLRLVMLNVTGAVHLTRLVLPEMVARGDGGVLFTSSIAATMPAPYNATYGASKAFLQSFAEALRVEVQDRGVTVTALMPGPTDTEFFARAGLERSRAGRGPKDAPADVARDGFAALQHGRDHVVAGSVRNRLQAGAAKVLPQRATAAMHGAMNTPYDAPDRTERLPGTPHLPGDPAPPR